MSQNLIKNWLLVLAAVLQAAFAVVNLLMRDPDGIALRGLVTENTAALQAQLALAAGFCTIAAGLWRSRNLKSRLLVLNGLALCAYGLVPAIWSDRPLSFRPWFALLLVVMATSVGLLAIAGARNLRNHVVDAWLLGLAGAIAVGFAATFLALDFRWIKVEQPGSFFLLLACFFASSSVCMLGLALLFDGQRPGIQGTPGSTLRTA